MATVKKISATVFYNDKPAGILNREGGKYQFTYNFDYANNNHNRPVSITLPLRSEPYHSGTLFPVFINMLSEGSNKGLQCRLLKIDENDYFSLLLATSGAETIGPITIKPERIVT